MFAVINSGFTFFIDCCRGENLSENLNRLTAVTLKIFYYDSKHYFRFYFGMFHLGCHQKRCRKSPYLRIGDCSDRFGWCIPRMADRFLVRWCHCRSSILHILLDIRQIQHSYEVVVLPRIIKPKKKKDRCFPSRKQRFFLCLTTAADKRFGCFKISFLKNQKYIKHTLKQCVVWFERGLCRGLKK